MKRLPSVTWTLLVANALLASLVIGRLTAFQSMSELQQRVAVPEITIPRLPDRAAPTPVDYEVIRTQALFQARREFFVVPDPLTAPGATRPHFEFVAAMVMPNQKSVAYLRPSPGAPSIKVKLGDTLEGWTITQIETRRVVAELGGEQLEFAKPSIATGLIRVQGTQAAVATGQPGGTRVLSAGTPVAAPTPPSDSAPRKPRTYRPPPGN